MQLKYFQYGTKSTHFIEKILLFRAQTDIRVMCNNHHPCVLKCSRTKLVLVRRGFEESHSCVRGSRAGNECSCSSAVLTKVEQLEPKLRTMVEPLQLLMTEVTLCHLRAATFVLGCTLRGGIGQLVSKFGFWKPKMLRSRNFYSCWFILLIKRRYHIMTYSCV